MKTVCFDQRMKEKCQKCAVGFTQKELEIMLEWYQYLIFSIDVPIHEQNINLAYKIQEVIKNVQT